MVAAVVLEHQEQLQQWLVVLVAQEVLHYKCNAL